MKNRAVLKDALFSVWRGRELTVIAGVTLAIGVAFRSLPFPQLILQGCDGRAHYLLATSLVSGRGFYLDDPFLMQVCRGITPGPSSHYSPGMPLFESLFVLVLGDSSLALVLPVLLLAWGAVAVVWWTTRDLYGEPAGVLVAAAVSIEWTGIYFGAWFGYAENLVLIGLVLTVWAVLKGLRDDRFMVLAGLFASIGYLSKASIGWFFLIAGIGGVVWRVWYRGWAVLRNRWYIAAVLVFAVPVAIWSARNVSVSWDGTPSGLIDAWQTSRVFASYIATAISDPGTLVFGMLGKLPILLIGLGLPLIPFWRSFRHALSGWREEETLGLWLTASLIFFLGWAFAAITWLNEGSNLIWSDPLRYVAPAQVPLLWLVVREKPIPPARAWALMYVILAFMFFAMSYLSIGNGPLPD